MFLLPVIFFEKTCLLADKPNSKFFLKTREVKVFSDEVTGRGICHMFELRPR